MAKSLTLVSQDENQLIRKLNFPMTPAGKEVLDKFIQITTAVSAKGSHNNTAAEQMQALKQMHTMLREKDRGLYVLMANYAMRSKNWAALEQFVLQILGNKYQSGTIVSQEAEISLLLSYLLSESTPAVLRILLKVQGARLNNARVRRVFREVIFAGDSDAISYRAINYRSKLLPLLKHCLSAKVWGGLVAISQKTRLGTGDGKFVDNHKPDNMPRHAFLDMVAYVAHVDRAFKTDIFQAVTSLKDSLLEGGRFSPRIVRGYASRFHPDADLAALEVELADNMSTKDRVRAAAAATAAGAAPEKTVTFNPNSADVRLLLEYVFTTGQIDPDVSQALDRKFKALAVHLQSMNLGKTAVVFDASQSTYGTEAMKNLPLRQQYVALEVIRRAASMCDVHVVGGQEFAHDERFSFCRPSGETNLALAFARAVRELPDTIILITDGYENVAPGLVNFIAAGLNGQGPDIYHITSVAAAESAGARVVIEGVNPIAMGFDPGTAFLQLNGAGETELFIRQIIREVLA